MNIVREGPGEGDGDEGTTEEIGMVIMAWERRVEFAVVLKRKWMRWR